jgi:hypothetical protein
MLVDARYLGGLIETFRVAPDTGMRPTICRHLSYLSIEGP